MTRLSVMGPVETKSEMRLSMTRLSVTGSVSACRFRNLSSVRDRHTSTTTYLPNVRLVLPVN